MVKDLRKLMSERNIDAYIITSADAHAGKYLHSYWKLREYVSGFTGSEGTIVITGDKAGLWTDGRYFLQAEAQLTEFELYKLGVKGYPTVNEFLAKELKKGGKIAFDGRTVTYDWFNKLKAALKDNEPVFAYEEDVAGLLWKDRPDIMPTGKAFEHEPKFAGTSAAQKLSKVREKMKEKGYRGYLISALDDIAWLLNMRGSDVAYLPVVYSYVFITEAEAHVFASKEKLSDISAKLTSQGFSLHNYEDLPVFLREFDSGKLYFNAEKTNVMLAGLVKSPSDFKSKDDIVQLLKAVKSRVEIANIKNAYIREGVQFVKLLKWIDEMKNNGEIGNISEIDVAKKLTGFRESSENYLHDSFSTIAAYGPNAASAHYNPENNNSKLKMEGFLLIDSGGQYLDGTTDTTRTIPLGSVTDEMKKDYTLVLQGHIAIDRTVFVSGTTGHAIDAIGRMAMWREGVDFLHGIGHGIGYCLNVHEGPQRIAPIHGPTALQAGMLLSNEPGIYRDGKYGIRTENTILVIEKEKTEFGEFLQFETIMYCPIDTSAIELSMLTEDEKIWLNNYHQKTCEKLSPFLNEEEKVWLKKATKAV